jgi:hypothetical protein
MAAQGMPAPPLADLAPLLDAANAIGSLHSGMRWPDAERITGLGRECLLQALDFLESYYGVPITRPGGETVEFTRQGEEVLGWVRGSYASMAQLKRRFGQA